MMGTDLNRKRCEKTRGEWGESEGTPVNILNKDRSDILDSSIPSYCSIMTLSVNTRAPSSFPNLPSIFFFVNFFPVLYYLNAWNKLCKFQRC